MQSRIEYLDGLRGVAILLVLGFHSYSRWSQLYPYGNIYADIPVFKLGWVGVELFFLISGFVIFMTLENTKTFLKFIYKRWIRLFPAMLLASIIVYASAPLFHERPLGNPSFVDLLPGLTFLEPHWWSELLGIQVNSIESAFWSLYVEFKFYLIAGGIYYFLGRRLLVPCLILLFLGPIFISKAQTLLHLETFNFVSTIAYELSLKYFGWFAAGALFYVFHQTRDNVYYISALFVSALSAYSTGEHFSGVVAALLVTILFAISIKAVWLQQLLKSKFLLLFGFISYPLYLIHENILVSLIIKMKGLAPWLDMYLYPLAPIAFISIMSFCIAKFFEPLAKKIIEFLFNSLTHRLFRRG